MKKVLKENIRGTLFDMNVPPNLLGFKYIENALLICIENGDDYSGHLKCLYDEIAQMYDTTPCSVERCIRNAIALCWQQGSNKTINILFRNMNERPTNSQFISRLYYYMDSPEIKIRG